MASSLINQTRQKQIARVIEPAFHLKARIVGLLGHNNLPNDHALWIKPCNSIHTLFMKFSIDVIFVDQDLRVLRIYTKVSPWRMLPPVWGARSCFELAAGQITEHSVEIGDQLYVGT